MSAMQHFPTVTDHGVVTHVMVPIGIYQQLTVEHAAAMRPPSERDIDAAIAIETDPGTAWQDAVTCCVGWCARAWSGRGGSAT